MKNCHVVRLICPKQGQIHEFSESVHGILDFSFKMILLAAELRGI